MFTLEQIKAAHAKVKSGADFPSYIKELNQLGLTFYETFVSDGHTRFVGKDNFEISSPSKYDTLTIANQSNIEIFINGLKEHQLGKTDYLSFCNLCAQCGVEKWEVCMEKMTCTYIDKAGQKLLVEIIPQ